MQLGLQAGTSLLCQHIHPLMGLLSVLQEYWLPINALTAIMFPILAVFEITRLQGYARTGKVCPSCMSTLPCLQHICCPLFRLHTSGQDKLC